MSEPFLIRPANRDRDNAALCELARRCPQGRRLRFYHERTDYWERGRLQPQLDVLIVEEAAELSAAVSVARKELSIQGIRYRSAYVHDLMVRPDRRGRGLGRALLAAVRAVCCDVQLVYCYIVEDNDASRQLFESMGFTAHPRRLLYHALLPALARRRPFCRLRLSARPADGLFELQHGAARAWATLRHQDAQVFVELPWSVRLLGRFTSLVPTVGRPVRAWTLHQIGHNGPFGRVLLRRLVRGVAWHAAQAGVDAVVLPLPENDPLTPQIVPFTLTAWRLPPGAAYLYVAGTVAERVLQADQPFSLLAEDA